MCYCDSDWVGDRVDIRKDLLQDLLQNEIGNGIVWFLNQLQDLQLTDEIGVLSLIRNSKLRDGIRGVI